MLLLTWLLTFVFWYFLLAVFQQDMYMWQNISSCHCTYFLQCLGRMFSHHCHILWESLRLVECLRMLFLLDLSVLNNPQFMFKVRFLMVLISKLWIDHLICIQLWAISVLLMHFHFRCPHSSICKFAKNVWVQLSKESSCVMYYSSMHIVILPWKCCSGYFSAIS